MMHVNIRMAAAADAEQILDIYRPVVLSTPISFEYEPPSVSEMVARIEKTLPQYPWLLCELDGRVAGYVYAGVYRQRTAYQWSTEVTAYVHEQYRGRGVGSTLYRVLFELLVLQGYYNAFAGITLPNPASVALHESVGFKPIGVYHHVGYKFGQWHDVGWWEHALQASKPEPEPPRSIQDILAAQAVSEVLERGRAFIRV